VRCLLIGLCHVGEGKLAVPEGRSETIRGVVTIVRRAPAAMVGVAALGEVAAVRAVHSTTPALHCSKRCLYSTPPAGGSAFHGQTVERRDAK
jgi:hypothetical protein